MLSGIGDTTLCKSEITVAFCRRSLPTQLAAHTHIICPVRRTARFDENSVVACCLQNYGLNDSSFVFLQRFPYDY